jgi:hypothetical protein
VLYGGLARALWAPDYPLGIPERTYRREVEEDAETFMTPGELEALARSGFPSADQEEVRAWVRIARYGASPATWEALDRMNMSIDVREVLPVVSAPRLVLRQRGDPWVRAEHCRYLAEHIPGAMLAELDGDGHIPTAAAARQILAQMIPFVRDAATREAPEPDKVLATILFSDIVGSTARAAELGDTQWRQLLTEHDARVRRQLGRFRGVELDTARDEFFARVRRSSAGDPLCGRDPRSAARTRPGGAAGPAYRRVRGAGRQGGRYRSLDRRAGVRAGRGG